MTYEAPHPAAITKAEDVTDRILVLVANCVEDWFADGVGPAEDFIDRLCESYLNAEGWDVEDLGTPAVGKIMRHARRVRNELR